MIFTTFSLHDSRARSYSLRFEAASSPGHGFSVVASAHSGENCLAFRGVYVMFGGSL
jgi:hypothetical protein